MEIGHMVYDAGRGRWTVVGAGGVELRELHCGDTLTVRDVSDDGDWFNVRMELDGDDWWYMVTEAGAERDDFELMDVRL